MDNEDTLVEIIKYIQTLEDIINLRLICKHMAYVMNLDNDNFVKLLGRIINIKYPFIGYKGLCHAYSKKYPTMLYSKHSKYFILVAKTERYDLLDLTQMNVYTMLSILQYVKNRELLQNIMDKCSYFPSTCREYYQTISQEKVILSFVNIFNIQGKDSIVRWNNVIFGHNNYLVATLLKIDNLTLWKELILYSPLNGKLLENIGPNICAEYYDEISPIDSDIFANPYCEVIKMYLDKIGTPNYDINWILGMPLIDSIKVLKYMKAQSWFTLTWNLPYFAYMVGNKKIGDYARKFLSDIPVTNLSNIGTYSVERFQYDSYTTKEFLILYEQKLDGDFVFDCILCKILFNKYEDISLIDYLISKHKDKIEYIIFSRPTLPGPRIIYKLSEYMNVQSIINKFDPVDRCRYNHYVDHGLVD